MKQSDDCTLFHHKNFSKSWPTCTFNTRTAYNQCIYFSEVHVCGDGVYLIYYHNADLQCKCLFSALKIKLCCFYIFFYLRNSMCVEENDYDYEVNADVGDSDHEEELSPAASSFAPSGVPPSVPFTSSSATSLHSSAASIPSLPSGLQHLLSNRPKYLLHHPTLFQVPLH